MSSSTCWIDGRVFAADACDQAADGVVKVVEIAKIRKHATVVIDRKMRGDFFCDDRLAEACEPSELALVAPRDEPERRRHSLVSVAETFERLRRQQAFLAAIDRRQFPIGKMAMAVVDRVAAAVGGDQERIVPVGIEQRR